MRTNLICRLAILLCLTAVVTPADSLQLNNGSLMKGRFVGGTETEVKFEVGSSVHRYNIADIASLTFDSHRPASTAKRTIGGAAVGSIIGAIAGGGQGAGIGAGVGGAAGAGSESITKGDQVKIPSETLLDFMLEQSVSMPTNGR
jgi:hypothetical protein